MQKESISTNSPIKYVVLDGDSHYSQFFKEQFNKIFDVLCQLDDFDKLNEKINELSLDFTFICDPLHIWKNQKTWLQSCKIVPNPFEKCHSIQKDEIEGILKLGLILNDDSQVSKMRDEYAVGLFNLDNSSK